jgi:hypothetical protein
VRGGLPSGYWDPSRAPTLSTTVPLAGFLNLSATCSSLRLPAIFRQVALVGFRPSGVSSSREAPTTPRRRRALLTFFPQIGRVSIPRWRRLRACWPLPRISWRSTICSSSGPSSSRESICIAGPWLVSRQPTFPSWTFASPWC